MFSAAQFLISWKEWWRDKETHVAFKIKLSLPPVFLTLVRPINQNSGVGQQETPAVGNIERDHVQDWQRKDAYNFVGSEEPEHVCQVSTLIGEVSLTLSSVYRWLTLGQSNHTWEGFFIINISYLSFWSLEDQTRGRCCNTMLQIDLLFSPKTIKF